MDKTTSSQPVAVPIRPQNGPAFSRPAQLALAFALGAGVVFLVSRVSLFSSARPTERERVILVAPIDLNQAGKAELMQLPGIGESTAEKIIATREARGGFRHVDDLRSVKGLGPTRVESLRPWVSAQPSGSAADGVSPDRSNNPAARGVSAGRKEVLAPGVAIDVNRASAAELQRLPGIGPVMSQRILAERERAPFRSLEDLRRVSGIGPKTLEKLRPHLVFGSSPSADDFAATGP